MSLNLIAQFTQEVTSQLIAAGEKYNIPNFAKRVKISIDISGTRLAGMAKRRGFSYSLRFHPDAIEKYYKLMVRDIIPHEIAHLVCMMDPTLGKHHNNGWKNVCRALGGDGLTTHNMKFGTRIAKKPKKKAWYKAASGEFVDIGMIRHGRLQNDTVPSYCSRTEGRILKQGFIGHLKPSAQAANDESEHAAA
jgi:predicted SprT family Zn-dependent metalloprotease